jgi:hypothetical protein
MLYQTHVLGWCKLGNLRSTQLARLAVENGPLIQFDSQSSGDSHIVMRLLGVPKAGFWKRNIGTMLRAALGNARHYLSELMDSLKDCNPHKYNKQALFFNSILISCSVTRTAEHTIRRHHQGICF